MAEGSKREKGGISLEVGKGPHSVEFCRVWLEEGIGERRVDRQEVEDCGGGKEDGPLTRLNKIF